MKKKLNTWYTYIPVNMDILDPCYGVQSGLLKVGDTVKTINKYGCPKFGTMGQCYVENLDGEFLGMISLQSLA